MEELIENIKEIEFESIEELYDKKEFIQERFKYLDESTRRIYKWYYFYQLCLLDYELKSNMWDYICGISGAELQVRLAYMDFKRKKEKYHMKYLLEEQKKKEL